MSGSRCLQRSKIGLGFWSHSYAHTVQCVNVWLFSLSSGMCPVFIPQNPCYKYNLGAQFSPYAQENAVISTRCPHCLPDLPVSKKEVLKPLTMIVGFQYILVFLCHSYAENCKLLWFLYLLCRSSINTARLSFLPLNIFSLELHLLSWSFIVPVPLL